MVSSLYRTQQFGEREYARELKMALSAHIAKFSQSQLDMLDVERLKDVVGRDCDLVASGFNQTTTGILQMMMFASLSALLFYFDPRLTLINLGTTLLGWRITQVWGTRPGLRS